MAAALLLLSTNHIISGVVSRICAMLMAVVLQESVRGWAAASVVFSCFCLIKEVIDPYFR